MLSTLKTISTQPGPRTKSWPIQSSSLTLRNGRVIWACGGIEGNVYIYELPATFANLKTDVKMSTTEVFKGCISYGTDLLEGRNGEPDLICASNTGTLSYWT